MTATTTTTTTTSSTTTTTNYNALVKAPNPPRFKPEVWVFRGPTWNGGVCVDMKLSCQEPFLNLWDIPHLDILSLVPRGVWDEHFCGFGFRVRQSCQSNVRRSPSRHKLHRQPSSRKYRRSHMANLPSILVNPYRLCATWRCARPSTTWMPPWPMQQRSWGPACQKKWGLGPGRLFGTSTRTGTGIGAGSDSSTSHGQMLFFGVTC